MLPLKDDYSDEEIFGTADNTVPLDKSLDLKTEKKEEVSIY